MPHFSFLAKSIPDFTLNCFDFRKFCGLQPLTSFSSPTADSNQTSLTKLQSVYATIDDIDLFTGGILEISVPGGVVGPTFACIIGQQFQYLLYGDRHFFTHSNQVGSLSTGDFAWARRRTFRDVLCDNTKIEMLQANVFLTTGFKWACKVNIKDPVWAVPMEWQKEVQMAY